MMNRVLFLTLSGALLMGFGCQSAPRASENASAPNEMRNADVAAQAGTQANSDFVPAAAGNPVPAPLQDQANDLIREMTLQGQERAAASRFASDAARKLMNELRYLDAEGKLQEALRLDPDNQEARRLLDQVHFVLGDRSGELRDFTREELEREKVRRQQAKVELQRLFTDGIRQMEDGNYDTAIKIFDQVLEQIEWFHFNEDLSQLRSEAQGRKATATDRAREQENAMRREEESRAVEQAEAERDRSLRFQQNRVKNLMRKAEQSFADKDYEGAEHLLEQVLENDGGNKKARALLARSQELRHLYRVQATAIRTETEWERTFLAQYETEIPYQDIFNFPSREHWNRISRKTVSLQDRILGSETSTEREIKAKLETQALTIEFPEVPFEEVIDTLQRISGINFVLTREAIEALEDNDDPVRLAEVKELPLKNILRLVLEGRDPPFGYLIKNSAVVIGPVDSIAEDLHLEFYEVSDITTSHPDFKAPRLALEDETTEDSGGGGGGGGFVLGEDDEGGKTAIESEVLQELLEKFLWPEDDASDSESVKIQGGKLVARTTLENHQKIQRLLTSLRKSTGIMVTVESRFLDLQNNFLEQIGIDMGNPFNSNLPNPIADVDGAGTQIAPGYEFVDAQGQFNARAAVYNEFSLPLGSSVAPFQIGPAGGFAFQYNVLDTFMLEAILEATQKTQEFRSLRGIRVTAFNTQTAHSLVVAQSAYVKDAEVNQTGVIPVINPVIGILNAGSILEIRPTVSHDRKYVILELQPTLATQLPSRFRNLTLGLTNLQVELPVLSVTKIKTTLTIPDGGTVLVGGLKRTILQDQRVGIPIISRLPGFDLLFGRKGQSRLTSNLFVLINAKITVIRDEEKKQFN
ncbi:MAG: hypothetical protein AAF581_06435 [Planctomycetota bacterium]